MATHWRFRQAVGMASRRYPPSSVAPGHPDFLIVDAIAKDIQARIPSGMKEALSRLVVQAVEFVLDPVLTGRTRITQLDNVEKTFIGLKVEHLLREVLGAPKGIRDLVLAGHDVDVKNTVGASWAWMIPPETYRGEEPCVLIAADEDARQVWMGVFLARDAYLTTPNRDGKRGVRKAAYANILWLVENSPWPPNRWADIDMVRFLDLRRIKGGSNRAALFFSENLRKPVHRNVLLALLFDQKDPIKRLRGNHGARDILKPRGVALMSGVYYNGILEKLGLPRIGNDEWIAVEARDETEAAILKTVAAIQAGEPEGD